MTARSPMRSARAPQASSVAMMPTVDAASSAPMPARERSYWSRISGAMAGSPSCSAEMLAWAVMPTASTAQRYRGAGARGQPAVRPPRWRAKNRSMAP